MGIHETTITELLHSFFNEEPLYIRKAIVEFLLKGSDKNFVLEDFDSFKQQGEFDDNEGNKLPDLVFTGKDSFALLEVKINNAELQESQYTDEPENPDCYVGLVNKSKKSKKDLFFLIPSYYKHKDRIPKTAHIITWKQLDGFVKQNEYDNPILRRIISLTSDFDNIYERKDASDRDMQFLIYDNECLSRISRIHNRLRTILDKCNCETEYFTEEGEVKNYRYDPGTTEKEDDPNPYNNKNSIAEGKYIVKSNALALVIFSGSPYIYLDAGNELPNGTNIKQYMNEGTYLYQVCELDTSIEDAVNKINVMLKRN